MQYFNPIRSVSLGLAKILQDTPAFLAYWRNARSRAVRVLEALEPEDLEWAPMPGAFTFGDLFRHLAGLERYMWAENVAGRPSRYPGLGPELAEGLEGVRAYLDHCHGEAMVIFGQLSDADLAAPCLLRLTCPPPEGTPAPSSQSRSLPSGTEMATSA